MSSFLLASLSTFRCISRTLLWSRAPVAESLEGYYHQIDSRLQPVYRVAHRLAELICPLPARSPPKCITDIGAEYPEVHAILFIGHLVLVVFEHGMFRSGRGMQLTLITVRRVVTTPKTAGAGVMLAVSFPMPTRLMATSSERIARLRFFDLSVMVETQGTSAR